MPDDELPIILVSAADATAAEGLISDLIGEEGDLDAEDEGANTSGAEEGARVWRLRNKYYSARVRVQPAAGELHPTGAAQRVHAHLVLLQPHEGVAELEARAAVGRRLPACEVRLVLAHAVGEALGAAARREDYEPVALSDATRDDDEPTGLARAREALHAHVWPGLRLHGAPAPVAGEDDEWQWHSAPLGALGLARAAVGQAGLSRDQRLLRAEALLAAFCRALADPDEG